MKIFKNIGIFLVFLIFTWLVLYPALPYRSDVNICENRDMNCTKSNFTALVKHYTNGGYSLRKLYQDNEEISLRSCVNIEKTIFECETENNKKIFVEVLELRRNLIPGLDK